MPFDSAGHVDALLEVPFEREVDKWAPQGGQFERGRATALHDRQVRSGQVFIEVMNVATPFHTLGQVEGFWIEARTGYRNHAQ